LKGVLLGITGIDSDMEVWSTRYRNET
jgi:hypothetical protein